MGVSHGVSSMAVPLALLVVLVPFALLSRCHPVQPVVRALPILHNLEPGQTCPGNIHRASLDDHRDIRTTKLDSNQEMMTFLLLLRHSLHFNIPLAP